MTWKHQNNSFLSFLSISIFFLVSCILITCDIAMEQMYEGQIAHFRVEREQNRQRKFNTSNYKLLHALALPHTGTLTKPNCFSPNPSLPCHSVYTFPYHGGKRHVAGMHSRIKV
jgi:uncharacterized membrane protein